MRLRLIVASAALTLSLIEVAQAQVPSAPEWTVLGGICWRISSTAGQCAVRLSGTFPTRAACIAANNGQLETTGEQNGMLVKSRCEMLWK